MDEWIRHLLLHWLFLWKGNFLLFICSRTSAALARRKHVVSWEAELFDQLEFYELAFGLSTTPPPTLIPGTTRQPHCAQVDKGKGRCARENAHVLHCGESENAAAGEVIRNATETAETSNVAHGRDGELHSSKLVF